MDIDFFKEQLQAKELMLAQTTNYLINIQKELERKNIELVNANRDIFDSINFATTIQKSLLPREQILKIFFKDAAYKVIQQIGIGGDSVFIKNVNHGILFGLLDSTGHGIPAAMLSISGTIILKELIYSMEIENPSLILKLLNQQLYNTFFLNGYENAQKEGVIFSYNTEKKTLQYSSARGNALFVKVNGEVIQLESSKKSIGEMSNTEFDLHEFVPEQKERLLIFSDGLRDQFGGPNNKKFSTRRLKSILENGYKNTATELSNIIQTEILTWKKENFQTDDISFIIIDF